MTFLALDQIRLDVRSHLSALWWLGLVYRWPKMAIEAERHLSFWQSLVATLRIYLHALPYVAVLVISGRWYLFGCLKLEVHPIPVITPEWAMGLSYHGYQLALGIGIGFIVHLFYSIFGFVFESPVRMIALSGSLIYGPLVALIGDLMYRLFSLVEQNIGAPASDLISGSISTSGDDLVGGLVVSFAFGVALGLINSMGVALGARPAAWFLLGLMISPAFGLMVGFVTAREYDTLLGFTIGFTASFAFALGFLLGFLRLYYIPLHCFLVWPVMRAMLYRFHPVAWDGACVISFPGFDQLLVGYAEYDPETGEREIDRLIDDYQTQRAAALRARAILVARRAAATSDLARLDDILGRLPAGEEGFLKETPELRRRAHEITALQSRLDTLDRPFLREPFTALLVKEIEAFEQRIAGFSPPLSTELRKAAREWLVIAYRQREAARAAATREPTRQLFRAGDPVDREREAFVLRGAILGELERQVMLATGCPGLLIYGRRRMGKSTLLRNLEGLLPPRVQVVGLSMQEARAFTSLPDLVALIGQRVAVVLANGHQVPADLKGLQYFLDWTQERLDAADSRLLLAIDEYEYLDHKIGEGALSEDLLAVLRESIQTHRRIIWAFAGSHGIDELVHAPWSSYLVSARTLEVTPFELAETRLLLTEPLKHSSLWRAAAAEPPHFEPGFWGDGGIERIHAEAGGWPHLVQLVAETVVDLVNDAGATSVDDTLFERALDRAVVRGNNVMLELVEKESRLPGEWDYLRAFRRTEEQPAPADEAVARSLRRRRLVVEDDSRYRLRVPLMARWLRQRV